MDLNDIPEISEEIVVDEVDGEKIVIRPEDGKVNTLNETGAKILGLIDGKRSVNEISDEIARLYSIGKNIAQSDVLELINKLEEKKIIKINI
jgi:hypothetical protein